MNTEGGNETPQQVAAGPRDYDGLHRRRGMWHFKLKVAGKWKEISTHTRNYQQARKIRQEALQAQEQGRLPTDMAKWPFEKAASEWRAGRDKLVAPQTARMERERLKPLLKAFGGRRLCEISSADVRGYQVLRAAQVGNRTVNLETTVLRLILRTAKLWGRLVDDFKSLPEDKRGPGRALSPEEEKRLFETAARHPRWDAAYYAALLASNTTARACELKGLRLGDVDLFARTLTIRRGSTKTDAGARVVPLNETAMWAAARLIERASILGAAEPQHYLFPAFEFHREGAGTGYDPTKPVKTWRTAWRTLTKAAALPHLRFHDLRHHCITKLAEAGVPDQTLMAIAGHVSRAMLEHYSHVRVEAKRQAVAAIDSLAIAPPAVRPAESEEVSLPS